MNELQMRINSIIQILASELSKASKVVASLQAFSGMDITHFSNKKMKSIYKYMASVDNVITCYPVIKTYDDYNLITDTDLNKILKNVQQLCIERKALKIPHSQKITSS